MSQEQGVVAKYKWANFNVWRGRLPHWRADDVTYYATFRHRRDLDEIRMRAGVEPAEEEIVDMGPAEIARRERDAVDHDERDALARRPPVAMRRGAPRGACANARGIEL